ncbi:MAG: molybdate ABC transporter permease subunit, partial [Nodosilinea sp.]
SKHRVLEYPHTVSAARLTGCKNISRAVAVAPALVRALDWNCTLQVAGPVPNTFTHIGMRAHQLGFLDAPAASGTAVQSETDEPTAASSTGDTSSPESQPTVLSLLPAAKKTKADARLADELCSQTGLHTSAFCLLPSAFNNTFPCWLAMTSETPHRMTLYLKLNQPPNHPHDYHVQAEVFKDNWARLETLPLPWTVILNPDRLMLLA